MADYSPGVIIDHEKAYKELENLDGLPLDLSALRKLFPIVKSNLDQLAQHQFEHEADLGRLKAETSQMESELNAFAEESRAATAAALKEVNDVNTAWTAQAEESQKAAREEAASKISQQAAKVDEVSNKLKGKADRLELLTSLEAKADKIHLTAEVSNVFRTAQSKWEQQELKMADHRRSTETTFEQLKRLIQDTETRTKQEFLAGYSSRMQTAESKIAELEATLNKALEDIASAAAEQRQANKALAKKMATETDEACFMLENGLGQRAVRHHDEFKALLNDLEAKLVAKVQAQSDATGQSNLASLGESAAAVAKRMEKVEANVAECKSKDENNHRTLIEIENRVSANTSGAAALQKAVSSDEAAASTQKSSLTDLQARTTALEAASAANTSGRKAFESFAASRDWNGTWDGFSTDVASLAKRLAKLRSDMDSSTFEADAKKLNARMDQIVEDMNTLMCSKDYCEEYCDEATGVLRANVKNISSSLAECRHALEVLGDNERNRIHPKKGSSKKKRKKTGGKSARGLPVVKKADEMISVPSKGEHSTHAGENKIFSNDPTELEAERRRLKTKLQDESKQQYAQEPGHL